MSRDYAKKSSSRSKHSVPGWVWMTVGLLVGLFVAFLVYLNRMQLPTGTDAAGTRQAPGQQQAKAEEPKPPKVNFDFYNMLPEFEVPVPEQTPTTRPHPQAPDRTPDQAEPKPQTQPAPENGGVYLIQAGSFSTAKDADTRRAQLALLGIVSKVQKVTIDGSKTYHRVRVGPYKDPERLNRIRNLLKENGIEFMLLKQRG